MARYHSGQPTRLDVIDTEILTVSTTAVGPTTPTDPSILGIFVEIQDQPVRWLPKTAPTDSSGFKLAAGDTATLFLDPSDIQFIRDSSATADATVVVAYLGA